MYYDNLIEQLALKFNMQDMLSFITLLIISFQDKQRNFLEALSLGSKGNTNSSILLSPELFMNDSIFMKDISKIFDIYERYI